MYPTKNISLILISFEFESVFWLYFQLFLDKYSGLILVLVGLFILLSHSLLTGVSYMYLL
jgi:hypothetical protein